MASAYSPGTPYSPYSPYNPYNPYSVKPGSSHRSSSNLVRFLTMGSNVPFELTVTGKAEIPHQAERALIHVTVSSSGKNKASVSDEVITTSKHIENLLRELAPKDSSPEAKAAAPLAHWNKTSLSSTSFLPYDYANHRNHTTREYTAKVTFDIRFKEFSALGAFGTRISSIAHVEVQKIDWILTHATEKAYRSQLRREAATDALEKARDYCEVLGCTNVHPVELTEGNSSMHVPFGRMNVSHQPMQMMMQQQAAMPAGRPQMQSAPGQSGENSYKEDYLEFRPQEVRMGMEVTVKFQADPVKNDPAPAATKRLKTHDENMDMA